MQVSLQKALGSTGNRMQVVASFHRSLEACTGMAALALREACLLACLPTSCLPEQSACRGPQ